MRASEATSRAERAAATALAMRVDESMGFERIESGGRTGRARVGWLVNMRSTTIMPDEDSGRRLGEGAPAGAEGGGSGRAAVDFYFIGDEGDMFKAAVEYRPYFLVCVRRGREAEVEEWVRRAWEGLVVGAEWVEKEDLSLPNHLLGHRRRLLKLEFINVQDLLAVRKEIMPIAEKNRKKMTALDTYAEVSR
jgi:DNA polymerase epsilon subunit 1